MLSKQVVCTRSVPRVLEAAYDATLRAELPLVGIRRDSEKNIGKFQAAQIRQYRHPTVRIFWY